MTDDRTGPDPAPGAELDPAPDPVDDHRVRAALADLGSPAIPHDVAMRLDATLADLVARRQHDEAAGAVDSAGGAPARSDGGGAALRARRRWTRVATVAAAAVVVVGVGGVAVDQLVLDGTRGADSVTAGEAGGTSADDEAGAPLLPESQQDSGAPGERGVTGLARDLPVLGPRSFAADVSRLLGTDGALRTGPEAAAPEQAAPPPDCPGPSARAGATTVPVQYDGELAALVVHPVEDGRRLVEAWTCSGETRLATARVAPPD